MATTKLESNRGFALIENSGNTINNSTTEVTLFSTTIKAGQMGTNKIARFEITCHVTTPTLSIPTLTIKLKLGTAVLTIASSALSANISDKPVIITGKVANINATNAQYVSVRLDNSSAGNLIFSTLGASSIVSDATWAVDTTVDQTLSVTGQFGGLSSTTSIVTKLVDLNLS